MHKNLHTRQHQLDMLRGDTHMRTSRAALSAIVLVWLVSLILSLGFMAVVIWAIIELVQWLTTK